MKRTVEYICPFVPAELISAWGLSPCRKKLAGNPDGADVDAAHNSSVPRHNLSAGVCPIAESMLFEFSATAAAGVIFSTTCDQMRRAHEIFAERRPDVSTFLLNVPASWQDAACGKYYLAELDRLGEFLCKIGGRRPDDKTLADIIRTYAKLREENIVAESKKDCRIKVAIVGSELRREDDWIFSYVRDCGGEIVFDATCNGEMCLPSSVVPACVDDDPLRALAEMYFDMPHPSQRPDSKFFDYVSANVERRKIDGVVLVRMSWCDTCHGFARRLKQKLALPFLEISEADQADGKAHIQNRLSAFMEMFK